MPSPLHRFRFLLLGTMFALLAETVHAQVSARLTSRFLARGEATLLEIAISAGQPTDFPVIPQSQGFEIRRNTGPPMNPLAGRRNEITFEYLISSYETGTHVIPSFEVPVGGARLRTEPVEFTVFNPDDLKWSEAEVGGISFRYASAFHVLNTSPYQGETTPVEIKLYVPRDLFVDDWGIPDFVRDGLTAWRFQPSPVPGRLNLLGMPYLAASYPSTLTPTRSGGIGIGPAKIRLVAIQTVMDGFLQRVAREVYVNVGKLEMNAKPLPEGAPKGFENAVGSFRMEVGTEMTEFTEGDPIPVEIMVSGSGNLDTIRPPQPVESEGWKVYEATPEQRGAERNELSGSAVFRQFMRPLSVKGELPAYKLVYFDPKAGTYQTITSPPIPLKMKPATAAAPLAMAPPQALPIPVERMTDILGLIDPATLVRPANRGIPAWSWHVLGAALAAILVFKALWMRHSHRFQRNPVRAERLRELREVSAASDDPGFLLAAGRFIERWLGSQPPAEVASILEERDTKCFRGNTPTAGLLEPGRRQEILRILRKAAMLWFAGLLATVAMTGTAKAAADPATEARTAYDAARYDEAIRTWLKAGQWQDLAADTLYNIGNACYRAGSPGHAALYYRRALSRDPGHAEARQNLRFIERKYGSLTIHRPDYQYALARLPLGAWQGMVWAGAWLCGLALLVFPATRPGARLRIAAVAALVLAPLVAACGGLGWRYFPNDAEFAPVNRQAVIVAENAVLHADASRTSPEVIDAPPGSLCEVIRQSGRWSYVAFATKTRGWITTESIERIIPATPPEPPKIRKPKADGKSA